LNTVSAQDASALRAQLDQSRERVAVLAAELCEMDGELERLQVDRQQYTLLNDVCSALEKLDEHDATSLFWDGIAAARDGQSHLGTVRERIDAFQHEVSRVESLRQEVLAKLAREEDAGELIEDDLDELARAEEERQNAWVVDREDEVTDRPPVMPWTRGGEDDQRFRRSLAIALLASLFLGIVFPWIPLPIRDRWDVIEVPERFTRLVREQRVPPPPPVQELIEEKPDLEVAQEETPVLPEQGRPEPIVTPTEVEPKATSKGILAFREQFSSLTESPEPARLGSEARIRSAGEVASGRPTRSLVTTSGPGSSGGIDLASISRNVNGGNGQGIEGVQVARATSSIGAVGGDSDRPLSSGPGSSRTDEEIQIVFDRHKAALYRLYNRELRKNPTLQGQMVLRLTIEPDGSVSLTELKSTDMNAPRLAAQVLERVKTFDFGAKDGIPAITILYPIDFLPAS
jgi:hypothetical protein